MSQLLKPPRVYDTDIIATFERWRRFGLHGPVYEIVESKARPSGRGPVVRVCVVDTSEQLDCRVESLLDDPQER